MLAELATEEYSGALDGVVEELLTACGAAAPPIDALGLAARLGIEVAYDALQPQRARYVRVAFEAQAGGQASILVRPDDRPERQQWAVAHEIGEHVAHEVFERLAIDARAAPSLARERVANALAGRLLVPSRWLARIGGGCGWDLPSLKKSFSTASHELIARRMLEGPAPVVITVYDQARITWRRGSGGLRVPPPTAIEERCWRNAHRLAVVSRARQGAIGVQAWPIHEPHWKREIVRVEYDPLADGAPESS